jgi:ribosome-associated toxin RatA of RatAB toxin-antitoxin module
MTPRAVALCVLLSGTGLACMNTSQPRSRTAVGDRVISPPPARVEAHAAEPARRPEHDPAETPEVESEPVAGSRLSRSRATVLVRAPLERVRAVLVDFPNYHAFLPNYRSAKVESTTPDGATRVHMQIDGLGGMIRRWMRVEISAPVIAGPRLSFEAKLLEGDVKAFAARWVLDRLDEGSTRLTLESFLDPDLQLPATFIDSGSAAGLKESILAIKARAEDGAL